MDCSFSDQVRHLRIHPIARGAALLAVVVGILVCDSITILAVAWSLLLLPALFFARGLKVYMRFAVLVLTPIAAALFIVWGLVVKAPPGQPLGSAPIEGMLFAGLVTLRIALLSGFFQAIFTGLRGEKIVQSLAQWGIKGDLLVIILATFVMVPEGRLRADQVLTSRYARGLVRKRSWVNNNRQLPYVLRPMLAWTLRSAIERAELWQHRRLLERLEHFNTPERPQLLAAMLEDSHAISITTADYSPSHEPPPAIVPPYAARINSFKQLIERIQPAKVTAISGPNFSGRTAALRSLVGLEQRSRAGEKLSFPFGSGAYVGPEAHSSMSGLSRTVKEELALHTGWEPPEASSRSLGAVFRLNEFAERNPVTLSGGEQVCLALACAVAPNPGVLAIDCAFEQLDQSLRSAFLRWLSDKAGSPLTTIIADNRLDEITPSELEAISRLLEIEGVLSDVEPAHTRVPSISSNAITYRSSSKPFTLSAEELSFSYSSAKPVLQQVQLTLAPGQVYVLEGVNGSGKSTFAKLLCGVLLQGTGTFLMDGKKIQPWKTPGTDVAYHFQNPDVQLFETIVLAEVASGALAHGMSAQDSCKYALHLLEAFGLSEFSNSHPLDLPFVLRKRVAMAATLASGCPWVILDEPTLGQDQQSCENLGAIIENIRASGVGFIIISHSISFKKRLVNARKLSLNSGRVVAGGDF